MEIVEYDKERNECVYECSVCSYKEQRSHIHTPGDIISNTETYHLTNCIECGEEYKEVHSFSDDIANGRFQNYIIDDLKIVHECVDCFHKIEIDLFEIVDTEGGSVECLYTDEDGFVAMPVAKEGYYFEKWSVKATSYGYIPYSLFYEISSDTKTYNVPIRGFEIPKVSSSSFTIETITPIFTTIEPEFQEFEVELDIENDLDVKYEYMYYKDSDDVTRASIFVYGADAAITEADAIYEGSIVGYNEIHPLPYLEDDAGFNAFGECKKYKMVVTDTREKGIISVYKKIDDKVQGFNCNEPLYIISDNSGESQVELNCQTKHINPEPDDYYYVDKWIDENGAVVSENKRFNISIDYDTTLIAVMKKVDAFYELSTGEVLLFSKNIDNTLTLEGVYGLQQRIDIVIPNNVNGVMVSGIGDNAFIETKYGNRCMCKSITVPETVVNFGEGAFANIDANRITILGDKENLEFSMFQNLQDKKYNFGYGSYVLRKMIISKKTLENMIQKLVDTFVDTDIEIVFTDNLHLEGNVLGHYEGASKKNLYFR